MAAHRVKIYVFVLLVSRLTCTTVSPQELPRGHGEELGKHRDSDGHLDILHELPSPQEFWDQYAGARKPVIFRGAGKNFPAFHLWTDQYLKENYGELEVKLEAKQEKDHVPVGERGLGRDTIRSFLETYQQKDSYTVSQLPDPLSTEVRVLPFLMCGTFSERILEANLWLSSGGTRSMLHKDADNAINCLLNGTKDWILIHPDNEKNVSLNSPIIASFNVSLYFIPSRVQNSSILATKNSHVGYVVQSKLNLFSRVNPFTCRLHIFNTVLICN